MSSVVQPQSVPSRILVSGSVDKAVRLLAGVTCLSSGTGCKAGAMTQVLLGCCPRLTLTLLAHMGCCPYLNLTLLAQLAGMGRSPHLTLTLLALLARMGCCPRLTLLALLARMGRCPLSRMTLTLLALLARMGRCMGAC